jgi:hypothetical protein
LLRDAEASSARALAGSKDYRVIAMSHYRQMIVQRQWLLDRI